MKTKDRTARRIATAVVALALASTSFAQQADKPPVPGTYYSAKDFEWSPPWPFNPHPELQAVEIAPGIFVFDDTAIPDTPEQAAARKQHEEAAALAKAIAADPVLAAAARQQAEEAVRKREANWQARLEAARSRAAISALLGLARRRRDTTSPRRSPSGVAGVGTQGGGGTRRRAAH